MGQYALYFRQLMALISCLLLYTCQPAEDTVFTRLDPSETGLSFVNTTGENDSFNILTNEYIYNGGGVGIGDFDQDGQADIFFAGSENENELFLNRGDWQFENISAAAGIGGGDTWNNGVTIADVNNDGLDDIYVCATLKADPQRRKNQLYLNLGKNAAGLPEFKDVSEAYGLASTGHNTQAAWLDYDQDGDLDVFLLVNEMVNNKRPNDFSRKVQDGTGIRTDKLYRQDQDEAGNITFTDVGKETGILFQGFALAVTVCDLNQDGWPDLYVSNDYLSNDLVYLNTERAGKRYFVDIASQVVKHTSYSAMGNDVADLNNDGLPDILAVDMLPADNLRRKMMLTANNYTYLINLERYGYHPQFTRNTLQISQSRRVDSLSALPLYSEVGMQAGLPATDWSWTPLVADFNLDGNKDVIITNGFPRDITDKDFGDYNAANSRFFSVKDLLKKIPSVKIPNVAFRADSIPDGIPVFSDVSKAWGIDVTSFSNGAAYADLDGDGDLDYVVNNIDDPAHVYRNNTITTPGQQAKSLTLKVDPQLTDADYWGSRVTVREEGTEQTFYWHPHRGYLSSHGQDLVVSVQEQATVEVSWVRDQVRKEYGPFAAGSTIILRPEEGQPPLASTKLPGSLLPRQPNPEFVHKEEDYIDFNVQPMLLRKLTQQGPGLAVTDWNKDGIEDLYVSGGYQQPGTFLQGTGSNFIPIPSLIDTPDSLLREELGALFFDADQDGDDDLYVVTGSYEFNLENGDYADRLFRNDGGRYTRVPGGLAGMVGHSGSCVRAADYDGDGDLDLFVGSRVDPHNYPRPVRSYLLKNESSATELRFVLDETATAAISATTNTTDALFTDYDNDGDPDLLVAGEWSPLRLYVNDSGTFREQTASAGLAGKSGWWNSLAAGDFDNDGDTDYLAGNLGNNSILKPTAEKPVTAVLTDMDRNGGLDFLPFTYFPDEAGQLQVFPFFNRNDFAKQVSKIKALYPTHGAYAMAGKAAYEFPDKERYDFTVNEARSMYLENTATGFLFHPLPASAQSFPVFGMLPLDVDDDEYLDLLLIGNDYGCETSQGFMNAGNGLLLRGQQDQTLQPFECGFYVPGEGRALVTVQGEDGPLVVAAQNSGPLAVFKLAYGQKDLSTTGRKTEKYWGSGYLGQSGRKER